MKRRDSVIFFKIPSFCSHLIHTNIYIIKNTPQIHSHNPFLDFSFCPRRTHTDTRNKKTIHRPTLATFFCFVHTTTYVHFSKYFLPQHPTDRFFFRRTHNLTACSFLGKFLFSFVIFLNVIFLVFTKYLGHI